MKDIKPLLMVLLSIALVSVWIYHIYDKNQYSQQKAVELAKDSDTVTGVLKDSLNESFSKTIKELDSRVDSIQTNADSLQRQLNTSSYRELTLKAELDERLKEINSLKLEIRNLLDKKDFSRNDGKITRQKIRQLQEKVRELSEQNSSMEEEKKQLENLLQQLTQNVDSLQMNIRRLSVQNEALNEKVRLATVFIASEVKIDAIDVRGSTEENTSLARKADKFVASFIVQNRVNQFSNVEVTTVLIQPDGKVLQRPVWGSGTFDVKNGGRKSFTRKIRFDYEKGEQKRLLFTVDTEKCQQGLYTFQVWHNGVMIGQATKKLT